jgi:hypothetical protein
MDVDETTIRARSAFPKCPHCDAIARPNILMFGDWSWDHSRCQEQQQFYQSWQNQVAGQRVVAVELGAGLASPTVRYECERQADVLIRINPREADTPPGGISIPLGAAHALEQIDACLQARTKSG